MLLVERNAFNTFHENAVGIVDEEAGTLTATFEETVRGVPIKWRIPGEGVIRLDAGTVTINTTWVTDLVTGEFISIDVTYSDWAASFADSVGRRVSRVFFGAMGA